MDGIHGRMGRTKERISKLEDRTIESTQYEQQRENRLKKINSNQDSGTYGTITKDPVFLFRVPEEQKCETGKSIQRNKKILYFGKDKPKNSRS